MVIKKSLTEKENYLRMMRGEMPEWVPLYTWPGRGPDGLPNPQQKCFSRLLCQENLVKEPAKDCWGVTYVGVEDCANNKLPEPGNFILDDIFKWRDVIKAPDISGFDWDKVVADDFKRWNVDRSQTALTFVVHTGYFQKLVSFMGFNEALINLAEEPEECEALFAYMSDFYCEYVSHVIDRIKPDIFAITDDIASASSPFMSPAFYKEHLKPYYKKLASFAIERGIPIDMHCCGKCEIFIDDWREFGVNAWQPAQTSNNLKKIKAKYGNSLAICGGFELTPELVDRNCPKELVVEAVRKCIDDYSEGGGYAFCGSFLGNLKDEVTNRKNMWIRETVREYGYYVYHH